VWDIEATDIAQFNPFELLPEPLTRMQLWGIRWQTLQMQPLCGAIRQELLDGVATVDGGTIPDDDHGAGDLSQQVLQKRDDVIRIDRAVLAMEVHLALWRQGADRGEMITRPPLS
jgi:hypothetical protein